MPDNAGAGPARRRSTRWQARLLEAWQRPRPTLACRLLQPLSWLYALLAALDRVSFRLGWRQRAQAPRPLVVVGNLVVGGAGKTPAVLALADALREAGWQPGVISRGYGRQGDEVHLVRRDSPAHVVGDEPLLIHLRAGVPVAVARRRVDAAAALCQACPGVDILISDDGLQHHALARDAEVWVFDDRGVGNGLLLPAGPLRERPPPSLPAHAVVLYSAGAPSTALPGFLGQRRLGGVLPLGDWWTGRRPAPDSWSALRGQQVLAAAGLARPEPFFAMLRAQGLAVQTLPLPDHHDFARPPWPPGTPTVVVTEKDAVKLQPQAQGATAVWVATLDFTPEPGFFAALQRLLPTRDFR